MKYIALLFCFVAFTYAALEDSCLTNSYAPASVNSITALNSNIFDNLGSVADIQTALKALLAIATAIPSASVQNVYTSRSNDDAFMVKNCKMQEGANVFCNQDGTSQWLAYFRNNRTGAGNNKRQVYATDGVNIGARLGEETNDYFPTTRPWYQAAVQAAANTGVWTAINYASGGSGKSYSKVFGNGVAASDRSSREYCGVCAATSYAVPVSQAVAASTTSLKGITTVADFNKPAKVILDALKAVNSSSAVNAFIGFDNKDSYLVKVCGAAVNKAAVTLCNTNAFLLYVTNQAVHSNIKRYIYSLSVDGVVGTTKLNDADAADYDVTLRQWYAQRNGWSEPYTFASSNDVGTTFAVEVNGGVAGTDRVSTEPCNRTPVVITNTPSCPQCPNSNSAATSALGCGVALAAAAAAYAF